MGRLDWLRISSFCGRVILVGALAFAPLSAKADELDDQKAAAEQEYAELTQERAELEKTLEGTNEKLRKAVLALHDVEKRLPIAKAELASAAAASQAAEREVAELAAKLADAEAELNIIEQMRSENESITKEAHRQMAAMARQAARGDQLTMVGLITGAQSAADFVATSTSTAAVARAQARTIAEIQDADAAARNTEARITAIAEQITKLKEQAGVAWEQRLAAEQAAINKQNEVANLVSKQQKLTNEIEDQRDEELQELEDAIADQEAIAQTIKELAAQQVERNRVIEEKRRQEAAELQAKADAEYQAKLKEYEKAKEAYNTCLVDAKAANDLAQKAAETTPTPMAPDASAVTSDSVTGESGAEVASEPSDGGEPSPSNLEPDAPEQMAPAPATPAPASPAPSAPTSVATVDPAKQCAALDPKPVPAPQPVVLAPAYGSFLGWPTENHTVTSNYGYRYHPTLKINRLHAGTDFRAQCGVPVYASQSGIVVKREWYGTGGNMILIDHGKDDGGANIMSRYLHLSGYNVALNQWVAKGQVIGYSGATGGVSTGCHLHFEVYVNGVHVNPLTRLPH